MPSLTGNGLPNHGSAHTTLRNAGMTIPRQVPRVQFSHRSKSPRLYYRLLVVIVAMMVSTSDYSGNIPSLPAMPGQVSVGHRACSSKSQVVYPVNLTDSKAKVEIYLQLYAAGHEYLIGARHITWSSIGSHDLYTHWHDHLGVSVINTLIPIAGERDDVALIFSIKWLSLQFGFPSSCSPFILTLRACCCGTSRCPTKQSW
ncbi:hypothetical protein EDB92DRAFT_904086 [Lactarius akahatsu]|uniref:Uncharacterized protein n=1 Tax=Lactarius akahatsu TaxID=416441 RepID=A0AAD4QCG4_9AGAM|nr:hypothetical protein EDB92DRAFT_904086 [Lactarius akahatsu]